MNQKVVKKLPIPIHCPVLPTYGRKVCSEVEVVQKYAAIGGVRTCMFVYRVSRVKWNKSLIMLAHASCFHSFPTTTNMLAFSTTPVGVFLSTSVFPVSLSLLGCENLKLKMSYCSEMLQRRIIYVIEVKLYVLGIIMDFQH